ncbi:glutaredoxin family protein [Gammaproteobacteria bacterium]|nr:glutaredoxin family protein [Gammaproteobacteria bacterium]
MRRELDGVITLTTHRHFILALLYASTLVCTQVAGAEVYKWVDEQGQVYYTDQPVGITGDASAIDLPVNTYTEAQILDSVHRSSGVVMYSASWCTVCRKASKYFRQKGITFTEYDIEISEKGRREYNKLGARGVPVILVGDKRLNGFTEEAFNKLYYKK